MFDGRDHLGRPVFSYGLGVGNGRTRALEELCSNMGTKVLPSEGPLRPLAPDHNVHLPERGYGGDGVLGRRDAVDPHWGRQRTEVLPFDSKVTPAPPPPPPMGGLVRHSAPGDPAVYGTDPRTESIRVYGESQKSGPTLGDRVSGLAARSKQVDERIDELEDRLAGIEHVVCGIDDKLVALLASQTRTSAQARKPASRRTKAKGAAQ